MSISPQSLRQRRIFVDSSGYLAMISTHDAHHTHARATWTRLTDERWRTFTTNFVIAEAHALLLIRLGHPAATAFLRQFTAGSSMTIIRVRAADEERARETIFQYEDKDFSMTDATSFSVMERLGIRRVFTFDRHFAQFGFASP